MMMFTESREKDFIIYLVYMSYVNTQTVLIKAQFLTHMALFIDLNRIGGVVRT